ncbi:threonine aldolase family protein [Vallicoccus soli]|uniref:Low specificity L-threonine aldolase n=1 Tax=Vallicoccus soli TaxID=2339232 RepID=A0A3A3Z106_9ACTN|nr:GntG family PLP-dependent aldolase [Vallicoccus soli]RJK96863.1 low specificity L-threonine aldolase [Vallicoccus soli]
MLDLRSDTVTRPTAAMRRAMAGADVGDDVYGEDPTVAALERRVADLLGHEAGLLTATGSLANQLGMRLLVDPGEELLCDVRAHVVRAELGAGAALSGITTRTWQSEDGRLDAEAAAALMEPDAGPYLVSTAAVAVENTHNFGGGTVQPLAQLQRLRALTADAGVAVHLDGARLWNAHVAAGVPLAAYGACADTVSVCLSKGLGAPVGSVLVASAERVAQARVLRKRLGGGMRQVGLLAAAGLHALDHHVERLADDHARARRLAERLADADPAVVDPSRVETNIVVLAVDDAPGLARDAAAQGVLVSVLGPRTARLLTHLDVDDEGVDAAAEVLAKLLVTRR